MGDISCETYQFFVMQTSIDGELWMFEIVDDDGFTMFHTSLEHRITMVWGSNLFPKTPIIPQIW